MKVWITKYALTKGIFEEEVDVCEEKEGMVIEKGSKYSAFYHGEGREWHRTRDAAVKKAEQLRDKKIKSLEAQIVKLGKMDFETEEKEK